MKLDRRKEFLKSGSVKGVYDEHLIHREVYNPNKFEVHFQRNKKMDMYIADAGIMVGPEFIRCKPDDWAYLTHGYYFAKAINGPELFDMVVNYGDSIGIGNKKASLPSLE